MILDDIVEKRKIQLMRETEKVSRNEMEILAARVKGENKDFYKALKREHISIISEVKKASPSKSVIQPDFHPVEQAVTYEKSGANAISCLTEEHYFQGSSEYLKAIRKEVSIPVLRKDFIFDPYQVYEAKAIGADAILLIAAILDDEKMQSLRELAENLGLECLFEAHDKNEIERISKCRPRVIGINNRNLKTFEVSLENTANLAKEIPDNCVLISESGIRDNNDMKFVRNAGADAVLIGETLMRSEDVAKTIEELRAGL
jgi:indole-3-glycerol phosphate synthase